MPPATIRLPYLQSFKDRHGKWRHYYRRSGIRERIEGEPGSATWIENYQKMHASFENIDNVSFNCRRPDQFSVIAETYLRSRRFGKLKDTTKDRYRHALKLILPVLGDAPMASITRGVIVNLRDQVALNSPRNAIEVVKVVRRIIACALDHDLIDRDPTRGIT